MIGHGDINFGIRPEEYHLTGSLKRFNLENLVRVNFLSNLNGKLSLAGHGLTDSTLSLDITADLDSSSFDQYMPTKPWE